MLINWQNIWSNIAAPLKQAAKISYEIRFLFIGFIFVTSCNTDLNENAKDETMQILRMIKSGENQEVLDSYYGIEMNQQTKEVLSNMNTSVMEGLEKFGLPESQDIEVSTKTIKPYPDFAQDFEKEFVTIVTTESKLTGSDRFIVRMMFAENDRRLRLLNIGITEKR